MVDKSDIIFASLPGLLDPLARLLGKLGHRVFYLDLSNGALSLEAGELRALQLQRAGISPLPLESLPVLPAARKNGNADREDAVQRRLDQVVPSGLLRAFAELYPKNADAATKLRTAVQSRLTGQMQATGRVNLWARAHPDRRHLFVHPSISGLLALDLASNVRLLVLPVDTLSQGVSTVARLIWNVLRRVKPASAHNGRSAAGATAPPRHAPASRVVFVTHAGLSYGKLFQKTLYYSAQSGSELHPENLLHFDYSGCQSPSERLKWVSLTTPRQSLLAHPLRAVRAIGWRIVRVRSFRGAVGLVLLVMTYLRYVSYSKELEAYPDLELALIDYDVLCPKPLLLAFEARAVKTVAAQERWLAPFYAHFGTLLHTYYCCSEYVARIMKASPSYYADHYLPVGQYRTDNLVAARQSPPPTILERPIAEGRKVITALGFHTHSAWHQSQPDPLLNWTAHRHFLNDMVRLSRDIPDTFIVARFKGIDWMSLPVFADVIAEIASLDNIAISTEYEQSFFSYDLCAHSHLVIAKHTSLGDECLAVGIPVLFHEYSHNADGVVADAFDYSPGRIMCFDYRQLLERSIAVLNRDPAMTADYEYLRNVLYEPLGDGQVRARIHAHIESLLA